MKRQPDSRRSKPEWRNRLCGNILAAQSITGVEIMQFSFIQNSRVDCVHTCHVPSPRAGTCNPFDNFTEVKGSSMADCFQIK